VELLKNPNTRQVAKKIQLPFDRYRSGSSAALRPRPPMVVGSQKLIKSKHRVAGDEQREDPERQPPNERKPQNARSDEENTASVPWSLFRVLRCAASPATHGVCVIQEKESSPRAPGAPTLIATLPGDVQAMEETEIYPRTTGYLKKWHVDIGDHVEAGKLLAEIDAPEIMQQLSRSRATLDQLVAKAATAESTMNLAEITLKRNRSLPPGAISKQEIDESNAAAITARAAFKATEADIVAGQAEVQRYTELDSFSKITAPFAGTITARNIEIGQLVSAGSTTGQSLFRLAKTNPLRVYVNVPQIDAPGVKEDMPAKILVREQPGKPFPGTVSRTAKALDPITRTLRTEVLVPNDDGRLMVGSYVQVELEITRQHPPLLVPASALIFNASGMRVAVLDAENKVHFADVDVLGDYGTMIGVARGLEPTQRVVTNPGDRLAEGIKVQPDAAETPAPK
jgi:RND family efflux transporter MFP subunit